MPKKGVWLRVWGGVFCLIYFSSNVVVAAPAEITLWGERRQALHALPSLPTPSRFLSTPRAVSVASTAADAFHRLLQSVPAQAATVQETHYVPNAPSILIVQDVHLNPEAQMNIAAVIESAMEQQTVDMVGVEGVFGPLDFTRFWAFPDRAANRRVVEAFVRKQRLAAPSLVGVVHPGTRVSFEGIDDPLHYEANVRALQSASRDSRAIVWRDHFARALDDAKAQQYSEQLLRLDRARDAYRHGKMELGAYVRLLVAAAPADPLLARFLEVSDLESHLDWARVESERRRVLEQLTAHMSQSAVAGLVSASLAFRMGRLESAAFYRLIEADCAAIGVSLEQTPQFKKYLRYLFLADQLPAAKLLESVNGLERAAFKSATRTPLEAELQRIDESFYLVDLLSRFGLTPSDWDAYERLSPNTTDLENRLGRVSSSHKAKAAPLFNAFEDFYREAEQRSAVMVRRVLATPSSVGSVLVVGGFHTPQLTRLLDQENVSYAVVSPRLSRVDAENGSAYLSVFTREKTSLEKLLSGQRLFINPAGQNLELPDSRRDLTAALTLVNDAGAGRDAVRLTDEDADYYAARGPASGYQTVRTIPLDDQTEGVLMVSNGFILNKTVGALWEVAFQAFGAFGKDLRNWLAGKPFGSGQAPWARTVTSIGFCGAISALLFGTPSTAVAIWSLASAYAFAGSHGPVWSARGAWHFVVGAGLTWALFGPALAAES